jgi:outer membrane protein OmpA-like peptidoglycan-associated protein
MVRAALVLVLALLASTAATAAADPGDPPRHVVVTSSSVAILGPIRFDGATAALTADSAPMLDAIAHTLDGNPELRVIEVRAFGATGTARARQTLADRRARAIAAQLVRRGIAANRLRPHGIARPPAGGAGEPEIRILVRGS